MSQQLSVVFLKIREADEWMMPRPNRMVRNGHPELSFLEMTGKLMEHSKNAPQGPEDSLTALQGVIEREILCNWLDRARRKGASREVVRDAAAPSWSVVQVARRCQETLPKDAPRNGRGSLMEMVCRIASEEPRLTVSYEFCAMEVFEPMACK